MMQIGTWRRLLRSSIPCLHLTGKGREALLLRLQSVLLLLLLRPCRIPNAATCIKGHHFPQLQVNTGLLARQGGDCGAPALPEHHPSVARLFTAGRDGQLHGSSCNPVLAQRGLQTLAVLGGELLLPWGAVARAEQSSLSPATEA